MTNSSISKILRYYLLIYIISNRKDHRERKHVLYTVYIDKVYLSAYDKLAKIYGLQNRSLFSSFFYNIYII